MKPNTEGKRLKSLREALGATQDQIAQLGGLQRIGVVRAESDKVKWRSSELKEGLMRAYSMTYEQLSSYMSGEMSLRAAIEIATPRVAAALTDSSAKKAKEGRLADVFRRAEAHEQILQATKDAASVVFSEVGEMPTSAMVRQVISLNHAIREHIDSTIRAIRSDHSALK